MNGLVEAGCAPKCVSDFANEGGAEADVGDEFRVNDDLEHHPDCDLRRGKFIEKERQHHQPVQPGGEIAAPGGEGG